MRLEDWLLATIHDLVFAVKSGSLGHTGSGRKKVLIDLWGDRHPMIAYLKDRSEADILTDIAGALMVVGRVTKVDTKNDLLDAFVQFLVNDVAASMDTSDRSLVLTKSKLGKVMSRSKNLSYHGFVRACVDFLSKTGLAQVEYIQTPLVLAAEEKAKMRNSRPGVFVVFVTDQSLLGGMRRIAQGNIIDNSWLGRVQRFVQHTKV